MKKILVVDYLFAKAHKSVNTNVIEAISKISDLTVVSINDYYDDNISVFVENGIKVVDLGIVPERKGPLKSRYRSYEIMRKIKKHLLMNNYDAVICEGFETIALAFGMNAFGKTPLLVFHHKNIDELTNKVKRVFFNSYKNKIYHLVFEDFFKERLVKGFGVETARVFIVPHPLAENKQLEKCSIINDCVGLCNSNSEEFIQELETNNNELNKRNLNVVIRSKNGAREHSNISIIQGFLETDEYCNYIATSRTVLVPIPNTYIYRLSGSIYDALVQRKTVFTTSSFYGEAYEKRYPGICLYIENVEEFILKLSQYEQSEKCDKSFDKFINDHTTEQVSANILRAIDSVTH